MTDIIFMTLVGLSIGSFLNVLIVRIPNNESVVFGPSHCPTCKNKLRPWHNIPLLSWLVLRGKCSFCSTKISMQYPFVELLTSLLFLIIALKSGMNIASLFVALSFSMLISLSLIDLKYKMVPDSLNLLAILFAILGAGSLYGVIVNFQNAIMFAGGFTLLRFSLSYLLTSSANRQANKTKTTWTKNYHTFAFIEAMGEGDIMVAATMGALLGVELTLVAIFLSALIALPIMLFLQNKSKENQTIPFVPFLAIATFIVYLNDLRVLEYLKVNY